VLSDTILPALADYLSADKSASLAGALAEAFGETIPERVKAAGTTAYLPLVIGPRERPQPGQGQPTPTPTPEPEPEKGADMTVTVWPDPSIRVARNAVLTYIIKLYNDGEGDADRTVVTVPFTAGQLTPIGSDLDRGAGDWVSAVRSNSVDVTFGKLGDGKQRLGYVYFRVGASLADNTVLSTRPAYTWSDDRGTHHGSGNWAPVLVGGGNDNGSFVWTIVQPVDGRPGDLRTFYSNRFVPGETVSAWLNTPNGVRALGITEEVDSQGQVWLEYRPSTLAPGVYQMVIAGQSSRLTGVATFIVR
jgi:hypothetical protein